MPWVEREQIILSPSYPITATCDDVIDPAPEGDGVYEKGAIVLPLHVQCLCHKRAILMQPE